VALVLAQEMFDGRKEDDPPLILARIRDRFTATTAQTIDPSYLASVLKRGAWRSAGRATR